MSGTWWFWSKYTATKDPTIANPSPKITLFHGYTPSYLKAPGPNDWGVVIESATHKVTPIRHSKHPAISN